MYHQLDFTRLQLRRKMFFISTPGGHITKVCILDYFGMNVMIFNIANHKFQTIGSTALKKELCSAYQIQSESIGRIDYVFWLCDCPYNLE